MPHSRSFDDPEQLAEERRLMYVGLTRAKDRLYLSYAFVRTRFGESEPGIPSSFLDDIPEELVSGSWGRARGGPRFVDTQTWQPRPNVVQATGPQFSVGRRVRHASFGEGLVIESRAVGGDEIVTVAFEDAGLKRLMAGMAPMEELQD
jgi:DNA helicase-2/ATP-dependent DNA helicase PcrA